jgi:hypothetical protein
MTYNVTGIKWLLKIAPLITIFFISCSSDQSDISFDSTAWKKDLSGCKSDRLTLKTDLENIRLQLPGKKETNIRKLFGKPDAEELLERSQKIYVYYLTPGPKCGLAPDSTRTTALAVRFDALGNVREANLITE